MGYTQGLEGDQTPQACPQGFPPGVSPKVGDNSAGCPAASTPCFQAAEAVLTDTNTGFRGTREARAP